jgi:hypothetical protein
MQKPSPVTVFVAAFLSAVKDNAAISGTEETQDKILLGDCDLAEFAEICSG